MNKIRIFLLLGVIYLLSNVGLQAQQDMRVKNDMASLFRHPPESAKPWVSMWWFGKITEQDITQHLEELKDKGVGGALIIDLNAMPDVPFLSDPWIALFRHTVKEADRLGLKTASNVCRGWPSGGPWITRENSSWMTVSSTTIIKGPQHYEGRLAEPYGKGKLYRDVTIQAYPVQEVLSSPEPVITLSGNAGQLPALLDGNYNTAWKTGRRDPGIMVDFKSPHLVDWIWIDVTGTVTLEVSENGVDFNPVWSGYAPRWHNVIYEAVPATRARWYRLKVPENSEVREFALGSRMEVERVAAMSAKRALGHPLGVTGTHQADQTAFVQKELKPLASDRPAHIREMVDLTAKCSPEGMLNWDVPRGTWKVVRIGQTTTEIPSGGGLLPDYLSREATLQHHDSALQKILDAAGPYTGESFQHFREDNVEIRGMFSWTPNMLQEFVARRGYEPQPYMAALAGEIIESVEITNRFLADVRRTIADCVADYHYAYTTSLLNESGIKFKAEAGGQHHPRLLCSDGLMNLGRVDIPQAEFWENGFWKENQYAPRNHHEGVPSGWDELAQNVNAKQAASAAHLYGKKLVSAEAFTSVGPRSSWGVAPDDLLLYANIAYCEGINTLTIHGSATSGPRDGKPGKVFGAGSHFNHNVTWWDIAAEPFLSYLSRCQFMLQQGQFVADVLYYNGDEVPAFVPPKHNPPSLGFGYDYDVCNTEVLLKRLSVKDGMIVLPDGMSYRMLVLPDQPVMPVTVAEKIDKLVSAGATVLGPKPQRTPGLGGYPQSEKHLNRIAEKLWTRQKCGTGRVLTGHSIRKVLEEDGITPDFSFETDSEDDAMDYIHNRDGDTDIYFVINRRAKSMRAACTFRVKGKQPELWDPFSGETLLASEFAETESGTSLTLQLFPYSSMFVVFRDGLKEEVPGAGIEHMNHAEIIEFEGPWTVSFDTAWGGPESVQFNELVSWTSHHDENIMYYSGSATYNTYFDLPEDIDDTHKWVLDLGDVENVAEVILNGKEIGVAWKEPFSLEITEAVKPGRNTLQVKVVNLWRNRLIRDAGLPPDQRLTNTNIRISPDLELMDSGLLGPVRIFKSFNPSF